MRVTLCSFETRAWADWGFHAIHAIEVPVGAVRQGLCRCKAWSYQARDRQEKAGWRR